MVAGTAKLKCIVKLTTTVHVTMLREHLAQSRSTLEVRGGGRQCRLKKNSQRPLADSRDLRILKIGPKEQPRGSGYNTSIPRQTELVPASQVAILEQLSASIGEINQPISALVLNAEAALQLLLAQPTNTGAVRRLLACIVKEGLRTGDIVRRTRALIETAPPVGTDSPRFGGQNALRHSEIPRKQAAR
jgi:C4-dicarboxylate-specific signal transduction histidine kinase